MSKLLKVNTTAYKDTPGIIGEIVEVRMTVIDPKTYESLYDRTVTLSDITNKSGQQQLYESLHTMLDEALEVWFKDNEK